MRSKLMRLAACLLVILSVPGALGVFAFALPVQYDQTYLAGLQDKWAPGSSSPGGAARPSGYAATCWNRSCRGLRR